MFETTTGDIIKKLRIEKGYTQNELAIMLGVKLSTMQKYESGVIQNLKLETIRELCHVFNVSPITIVFPELPPKELEKVAIYCMREYLGLNEEGTTKAIEYINDLKLSDKYTK